MQFHMYKVSSSEEIEVLAHVFSAALRVALHCTLMRYDVIIKA